VRPGCERAGAGALRRGRERDASSRRGRSRLARSRLARGVADGDGVAVGSTVTLSLIGGGSLEPPAPPTSAIESAATAIQLAMVRV
jgi:hypothetical protein